MIPSKQQLRNALNPEATKSGLLLCAVEPREFARLTQVVSYICIALGLPPNVRLLLDALIGASDGEAFDTLTFSDIKLALYCRTEQPIRASARLDNLKPPKPASTSSLEKWVARTRNQLTEVQIHTGITLVSYWLGRKRKGKNVQSKYTLPILDIIQEIQQMLKTDGTLELNPEKAILRAVRFVLEQQQTRQQAPSFYDPPPRQRQTDDTLYKLACLFFDKLIDSLILKGENCRPWVERFLEHVDAKVGEIREVGKWQKPQDLVGAMSKPKSRGDMYVPPKKEATL